MITEKEPMKPRSVSWLRDIAKLDPTIRTVHLIEHRENEYLVVDHSGREDLVDFYGTEERIHDFLALAPAVILGSSGTINDIVGTPKRITVVYEQLVLTYIPIGEDVIALSLSHNGATNVGAVEKKIRDFVSARRIK